MKRLILLMLIIFLSSCTTTHEFTLAPDGTVYSSGNRITDEELKNGYIMDEIILTVGHDVPHEKVIELMGKLKEGAVKKVGIKSPD